MLSVAHPIDPTRMSISGQQEQQQQQQQHHHHLHQPPHPQHPQQHHYHHHQHKPHQPVISSTSSNLYHYRLLPPPSLPVHLPPITMPHAVSPSPSPPPPHSYNHDQRTPRTKRQDEVAAALEIARECPDGAAQDEYTRNLLDQALAETWQRVLDYPDSYVMTRDEYAVFNYFQHRFEGNRLAVKARARFWDSPRR